MRMIKTVVMLLGLVGGAMTGYGAATLPYSAGFDAMNIGEVLPADPWTFVTAPFATNSPAPRDGSAKAVYSEKSVTLDVDGTYSNVWVRYYSVMRAVDDDSVPADADVETAAACFYLHTNGTLYAYSDTTFVAMPGTWNTASNYWHGFAVHLDFVNKKWDIYKTGSGSYTAGDPLDLVNTGGPLQFGNGFTGSVGFTAFQTTGLTYLDGIEVLTAAGEVTAYSPTTIAQQTVSYATNRWYASRVSDTAYVSGQDTLGKQLGADLAAGLVTGDLLRLYTDAGWLEYELAADGLWNLLGGATPPANVTLTPGQPIWLQFVTPATSRFAIYDLNWTPAALAAQNTQPAACTIRATGVAGGWTAFTWDAQTTKTLYPANQVEFPGDLAAESVIFVINDSGQYVRGYWSGTEWSTVGGQPITLRPGNTIWIYNKGVGKTWAVSY